MSRSTHQSVSRLQPRFSKTMLAAAVASMACVAYAEEPMELETVVVTAAGFEQSVKDAPASISVISAEELKKRSYTDVTDALKNVAGVQIIGGGVEQSISIRGMTAGYTLFLIDGRPVQGNDAFGIRGAQAGTPINFLPPIEAIERIEVIRGPASALYGSDAMGGVVNIITKKVGDTIRGSITSEYTVADRKNDVNENAFQTSAYVDLPLIPNVLALQLNGAIHDQQESHFVGGSDSSASDPDYEKENIGGKLSWNINEDNLLTLGHTYSKQERTSNPGKSIAEDGTKSYRESVKENYFLAHEGSYGSLNTNSYVNYDKSENKTSLNATTGKGITYDVLTVNTQGTYFFDSHTVTAGLTHKYEDLKDGSSNGLKRPIVADPNAVVEMNRYQNSFFLEDSWSMTDDFTLTLSGRYDDNQAFGDHFSPKVYGVYHINENFTLKGGVTSGFKAPDLRNAANDYGLSSMGGTVIGNPDLKPEKSLNKEIGLAYENFDWGLESTLTVYVTDYKDKVNRTGNICDTVNKVCEWNGTIYPYEDRGYTANENVDEAELRGIEWTLDYKILDNLTYRHSYTFTETEQKSGVYKGEALNDTAKHSFNASLDWDVTERLNAWTQFNYRGSTSGRWQTGTSGSSSNGVTYPAYRFFDVGLGYKATKDLTLKAGVYNVANEKVNTDDGFNYNLDGRRYIFSLTQAF
ncbi:TonB-dependent receptor domain-containing protein [Pseudomonas sp. TTU2014-080ASC]|uniref:TonB-dependent receptor domain-containing protein n=1 Tax=Pseudomonas sp. TTU2014-080ASC TaxID=1729724 RepID=UPI000A4006A6|nr:TonB-dependent receptor [Pseudomonas sp. TTU2014-080ASC]